MNEKDIYQMQMTYKSVLIEIYDTDVIVIAMSYFELMSLIDGDLNMEVKFGTDILYDLKDCWAVFSKLQLHSAGSTLPVCFQRIRCNCLILHEKKAVDIQRGGHFCSSDICVKVILL